MFKFCGKRGYKNNSAILCNKKYFKLVFNVKKMKIRKKQTHDYWRVKHYHLITINCIETLMYLFNKNNPNFQIYVRIDDMFVILKNVHKSIRHEERDHMLFELNKK